MGGLGLIILTLFCTACPQPHLVLGAKMGRILAGGGAAGVPEQTFNSMDDLTARLAGLPANNTATAYQNTHPSLVIKVPAASVNAYKAAAGPGAVQGQGEGFQIEEPSLPEAEPDQVGVGLVRYKTDSPFRPRLSVLPPRIR